MRQNYLDMLLSPYRVLDLTDEGGLLCGRILADLGADVIQVEPPGGSPARRSGPFCGDVPHAERNVSWWAYAANKRSITLNSASQDGKALLLRLVANAHFVIESFAPGHMKALGLDYDTLHGINPGLVMVSISPYGQDGPYAHYEASDLTGVAMGGFAYITGDSDLPPVGIGYPQFYLIGAAGAAAGAMLAHTHRVVTGEGQYVDVSCQQAVAKSLSQAPQSWDMEGVLIKRSGAYRMYTGGMLRRVNWPCKDGYVNFQLSTGPGGGRSQRALLDWMDEEGMGNKELDQINWEDLEYGGGTPEILDKLEPPLEQFFLTHTRDELAQGCLDRRILLFPVHTPKDILNDAQLEARQHFRQYDHPDMDRPVTYLGPFIQDQTGDRVDLRRPAPRIGEHNREIYVEELGLAPSDMVALRARGVI